STGTQYGHRRSHGYSIPATIEYASPQHGRQQGHHAQQAPHDGGGNGRGKASYRTLSQPSDDEGDVGNVAQAEEEIRQKFGYARAPRPTGFHSGNIGFIDATCCNDGQQGQWKTGRADGDPGPRPGLRTSPFEQPGQQRPGAEHADSATAEEHDDGARTKHAGEYATANESARAPCTR